LPLSLPSNFCFRFLLSLEQVAEAVAEVNSDRATLVKYWERTGCLLTADGSRDDRIHLHSSIELGALPEAKRAVDVDDEEEEKEESGLGLGEGKAESKEQKRAPSPHPKVRGAASGAVPKVKREDVDNVKHDEDEFDLDDEADPDEQLQEIPLRDALLGEWTVIDTPPATLNASLENSWMVLKWSVFGWAVGKIVRFYNRKPKNNVFNYEIKYVIGPELRDHCLQLKHYSSSDDAPHGSWCLIRKVSAPSSSSSSSSSASSHPLLPAAPAPN
jgi:hypothetical protein